MIANGATYRPLYKTIVLRIGKIVGTMLLASCLLVLVFRWVTVPVSSLMMQRWLAAHSSGATGFKLRYQWVGLEKIAPHAGRAVMAAEDQRFLHHFGFDFQAMSRAWQDNPHRDRPRGASTITQQVAKNLFLWPGRSWLRKGLEAYFTLLLEVLWPKQRILEVYLNVAEFGPDIFGIQAASSAFFHKPAARLTANEAALLAAVLPNPRQFNAASPSAYVKGRAQWIERQARNL
ncbi:MAG: monofunctional biosynthetic peptidoglycan transglycosylase [Deltaproteobacteria bacterium CG_4_10_14_3_um_filter_60_8]|nr:MAG: monofunctional biosynthetic peptidoglycan transglycosylase [Desulfobacterales bacterium CG2_30_60_27]PIP44466.1 MAG: monofunctional biosynthetic peptidoglycan transglycosylase [Deltaproteobacteria bacterium CG23_combo_of_CG06-09_8_20_14_all_60_8]PIY22806.1 MAG: monofunctional biosynthetic peptidoglycan transglycosylase [Deltaproteobacteria bacterium CG_4_10_14_3_um_filter_60_8]